MGDNSAAAKLSGIRQIVNLKGLAQKWQQVYVGPELQRFIIPTSYLSHSLFKLLLEKTEEEFEFDHSGALTIPCEIETFKFLLKCIENNPKVDQPVESSLRNILVLLEPVGYCWQPQDLLPKPESRNFYNEIIELQEQNKGIPDDQMVVLVGDMITKMAQPTYHTLLNTLDGVSDLSGVSLSPWAMWTRAWSAEENRHGDVLNKYLYLTGRLDMKSIEYTIQYLIGSGMDAQFENNPYLAYIYFSFQERVSTISYGKNAMLAEKYGDTQLSKICSSIAEDERIHETAYAKIVEKLFEVDPSTTILALANMIKKKFKMPGHLMYDGKHVNIFENYSSVADRLEIYSVGDYGDILEYFIGRWEVSKLIGLSGDGHIAQDFVCNLPIELKRFEVIREDQRGSSTIPFSWIFGKHIQV
ncbi:hypothetical protein ACFE04_028239 [Oxalis oulophora]